MWPKQHAQYIATRTSFYMKRWLVQNHSQLSLGLHRLILSVCCLATDSATLVMASIDVQRDTMLNRCIWYQTVTVAVPWMASQSVPFNGTGSWDWTCVDRSHLISRPLDHGVCACSELWIHWRFCLATVLCGQQCYLWCKPVLIGVFKFDLSAQLCWHLTKHVCEAESKPLCVYLH